MPRASRRPCPARWTLYLPPTVAAALDAAAQAEGRSRSQMAARLLAAALGLRAHTPVALPGAERRES